MSETINRIRQLVLKDIEGTLSEQESAELATWINRSEVNRRTYEQMTEKESIVESVVVMEQFDQHKKAALARAIGFEKRRPAATRRLRRGWISAAASIVILFSVAGGAWYKSRKKPELRLLPGSFSQLNDLPPGGNKALLTLANGSIIVLDSASKGMLASQGNSRVMKTDSGEIAYQPTNSESHEVLYNMITTPKGGQYKLVLPDGSKVWLNAASTLRYPIGFTGHDRSVELVTGEAYFEIVRKVAHPFIVRIRPARSDQKDLALEVLGTSFDINAYPDEPETKATLLTGSVRVIKGRQAVLLQPGQQATSLGSSESIGVNSEVDEAGTLAWKNGLFSFDKAGTEEVMRQLARWYDVEVSYEGTIPIRQFVGIIPRNVPASDVLKALELSNVHFRIEGKKIIVTQ